MSQLLPGHSIPGGRPEPRLHRRNPAETPKESFPPLRQRMKQIPLTRSRDPRQGRVHRQHRGAARTFTSGAANGASLPFVLRWGKIF